MRAPCACRRHAQVPNAARCRGSGRRIATPCASGTGAPAPPRRGPAGRAGTAAGRAASPPADEEQRGVIGRRSVGVQHATAGAAVDEHPLALAADGDGDRLHAGAALVQHGAVARSVVDVAGPQAWRAVIAMLGAGRVGRDVETTVHASERAGLCARAMPRATGSREWLNGMVSRSRKGGRALRCVAHRSGNDEDRPGGRPDGCGWRDAAELAGELRPETRRAKNRPCGT